MNYIFFGRLTREKGFDLLVEALSEIVQKTGELPGNIFIFGEGPLRSLLFERFSGTPFLEDYSGEKSTKIEECIERIVSSEEGEEEKIYFFGWQSQATIRSVLQMSHFALMPSRFLETFGLSALESLSEGVPVIGFRKGGLVPFISEDLSVPFSPDDGENATSLARILMETLDRYSDGDASDWEVLSHEARRIADSYTEGRWVRQVQEILPTDTKKILLISDYTTLLGGIETHVHTIARTLRQHGYEVEVFGWNLPKGQWTKFLRLAGLVYSLANILSAFTLRKKLREFRPDAVWLHSVSRFLGPIAVREVVKSDIFSIVTYHDLGLLSPFPSQIESEAMIPKHPSLGAFLRAVHSNNPITYLATCCKYFQVYILRKFLRKINIHIVPSAFLTSHIRDIEEVSEEQIIVLEHFL